MTALLLIHKCFQWLYLSSFFMLTSPPFLVISAFGLLPWLLSASQQAIQPGNLSTQSLILLWHRQYVIPLCVCLLPYHNSTFFVDFKLFIQPRTFFQWVPISSTQLLFSQPFPNCLNVGLTLHLQCESLATYKIEDFLVNAVLYF